MMFFSEIKSVKKKRRSLKNSEGKKERMKKKKTSDFLLNFLDVRRLPILSPGVREVSAAVDVGAPGCFMLSAAAAFLLGSALPGAAAPDATAETLRTPSDAAKGK